MTHTYRLPPAMHMPPRPAFKEDLLGWAQRMHDALQQTYVPQVDRLENLVLSAPTASRPDPEGSRRFFYDETTGQTWIDVFVNDTPQWVQLGGVGGGTTHTWISGTGIGPTLIATGASFGYLALTANNCHSNVGDFTYTTSPDRLVIPADGLYLVIAGGVWDAAAGGTFREIQIFMTTGGGPGGNIQFTTDTPTGSHRISQTVVMGREMEEDDEIEFQARQDSGGNLNLDEWYTQVIRLNGGEAVESAMEFA